MTTHQVTYQINSSITPEQFVGLLNKCSLGARRPVDSYYAIKAMLDNADLLVTAWVDEQSDDSVNEKQLIGMARCVSDFSYCCYLSELAVAQDYQRQGIASQLFATLNNELQADKIESLLLEVRADNAPAIALYQQQGFDEIHRRKDYYQHSHKPAMDALIMQLSYV